MNVTLSRPSDVRPARADNLAMGSIVVIESILKGNSTAQAIKEDLQIGLRSAQYYLATAMYLGLVSRLTVGNKTTYLPTPAGVRLHNMNEEAQDAAVRAAGLRTKLGKALAAGNTEAALAIVAYPGEANPTRAMNVVNSWKFQLGL